MKMKGICLAAALALLLAGCSNNKGEDIDLAPDPIETEATGVSLNELRRSTMSPFIMPPEGTEEYGYYRAMLTWGEDCLPGQLCLLSRSDDGGVILKISDRTFRIETGLINVQPRDRRMIYAVSITDNGDCLVKVDQETGQETVLYSAEGEGIAYLVASDYLSPYSTLFGDEYLYFSDGENIMQLDFFSEEVTVIAESEAQIQELMFYKRQLVWQDREGAYYLYDLETGEPRPTTYEELHPFSDSYYYSVHESEDYPGRTDLYLLTLDTMEEELILENVVKTLYSHTVSGQYEVTTLYVQVGEEYIASANQSNGDTETVYESVTGDMELLAAATHWVIFSGNTQLEGIYLREGEEIVRLDGDSFEAGTLFRLENGLSEFRRAPFARDNLTMLYANSDSQTDTEAFYICGDCEVNNLMYCIWADKDGNWFWYHPHSGENEKIEVTPHYWMDYYFIRQKD